MKRLLTHAITLLIAPFVAAVALAATPIHIDAVKTGLDLAIARGAIPKGGALQTGIKQFLGLIQEGYLPEDASISTGVKLSVIYRLEQLGTGQSPAMVRVKPKTVAPSVVITFPKPAPQAVAPTTLQPAVASPNEPAAPPVTVATAPADLSKATETVAKTPSEIVSASAAVTPEVPVVAPSPVKPELKLAAAENPYQIANALVRGLTVANRTGEIGYHANLSAKVQSLVRELRRGVALEMAAKSSDVPQKTIKRLLQIGNL